MPYLHKNYTKGFTYPEMLVVVVIIAVIFLVTVPLYKQFNTLNELKNVSQKIRDELRSAQNRASSGVTASNDEPSHWVVTIHRDNNLYEYETGACPVVTDTSVTGYADRYIFESCPNKSHYRVHAVPQYFSISHQYSGSDEANIFFSSIHGSVTVYDSSGVLLGDTIDIRIESTEYPDMYTVLRVNQSGTISEERQTN